MQSRLLFTNLFIAHKFGSFCSVNFDTLYTWRTVLVSVGFFLNSPIREFPYLRFAIKLMKNFQSSFLHIFRWPPESNPIKHAVHTIGNTGGWPALRGRISAAYSGCGPIRSLSAVWPTRRRASSTTPARRAGQSWGALIPIHCNTMSGHTVEAVTWPRRCRP